MRTETEYMEILAHVKVLESALIEVDTYLAALNWWHVGNIGKAGEVLGAAIGWDRVRQINEEVAPKCSCGYTPPTEPPGDEPQLIGTEYIEKKFRGRSVPGTSTAAGGRY